MSDREEERLQALRHLRLLDTAPSESFDRITRMAAQLFGLPIAAVSLTDRDRQWFKSKVGIEHSTLPRAGAPCAEVAETTELVVIPDLLLHETYADSPLASSGIRFYAGAPLVTGDGFGLGALCVVGPEVRVASAAELAALTDLASIVMSEIELQHAHGRIDPVSGLPNRTQFLEDLDDLANIECGVERLVALVDIGRIEQVVALTTNHGITAIDDIVRDTARRLETALGTQRRVYQVGPTQFAYLAIRDVDHESYLDLLRERLRQTRAKVTTRFVMTPVVGVAPFVNGHVDPRDVLRTAYSAAQAAHERDDGVSVYSRESDVSNARRHSLLGGFGRALSAADELRAVFQPRIDLSTGQCIGAEALLRWNHPCLGQISPGEFVPLVERSAMARPMTEWILETAVGNLAAWCRAGSDIDVSVNVTASNLEDVRFVDTVEAVLSRYGVPARALELEITEGTVMGNPAQAIACLQKLKRLGVRIAIDDFGTGYSSLAYLRQLPIDIVKIDRSFIRNMATDEKDRKLVASLITLTQELGYRVVAEGVEEEAHRALLLGMGCEEAQGFLFARPLEVEDFLSWLVRFNAGADVTLAA